MLARRHHIFLRAPALMLALVIPSLVQAQPGGAAPTNFPAAAQSIGGACPTAAENAGPFTGIFIALYPKATFRPEGGEDRTQGEQDDTTLGRVFKSVQESGGDPFHLKNWYPGDERPNRSVTVSDFSELSGKVQNCSELQACRETALKDCKVEGTESVDAVCLRNARRKCKPCTESKPEHFFKEANSKIEKWLAANKSTAAEVAKMRFLMISAYIPFRTNDPVQALYRVFQFSKESKGGEGSSKPLELPVECIKQMNLKRDFAEDDLKKLLGLAVAVGGKDPLVTSVTAETRTGEQGPGAEGSRAGPPTPAPLLDPKTQVKVPQGRSVPMKFAVGWLSASVAASGLTFAILSVLNWSGATDLSFMSSCESMPGKACITDVKNRYSSGVAVAGIAFGLSGIGLITTLGLERHYSHPKPPKSPPAETTPAENDHE